MDMRRFRPHIRSVAATIEHLPAKPCCGMPVEIGMEKYGRGNADMSTKILAAATLLLLAGSALAQQRQFPPPGQLCPDGSDPQITGIGCVPIQQRNAVDEGRTSTTLPQQTAPIPVPNDPLGQSGNSVPISPVNPGGFGNPAIQQPLVR
jgi:hypothetical protein